MNILVTNAKNRIAYNIVRSLAHNGHQVFCADFVPRAMSFSSRYSSGHFIYPSPFSQQNEFIDCLVTKINELKIDVLIPVLEELFLISQHKDKLSKHVKMVVPDYDQILTAHNKDRWEPLAKELGLLVPRTFAPDELLSDRANLESLNYPVLIKPRQGGGGWGISEVDTLGQLTKILKSGESKGLPLERFIVQEKINGKVHCVAMVFNRGRLKGKVAYRQLREYPVFGGQATCRISEEHVGAEFSLHKLLEHMDWHGVCQADFIIDEKTNEAYLIDVNPRFWGSVVQSIASGVDFPFLVSEIALNEDVEAIDSYQQGIVTRWLGGDLRGFMQHFRNSHRKISFFKDFFISSQPATMMDDFSFDDPFPFLMWSGDAIWRSLKYRSSIPHESLQGEWS